MDQLEKCQKKSCSLLPELLGPTPTNTKKLRQGKQIVEKQMKKRRGCYTERWRVCVSPKASSNIWGLRQTVVIVVKLQHKNVAEGGLSPQGQQNKSFLTDNKWMSLIDIGSHLLTYRSRAKNGRMNNHTENTRVCFFKTNMLPLSDKFIFNGDKWSWSWHKYFSMRRLGG